MSDKKYALIIGTGLALLPIHNMWLADIIRINGESIIFLPAFGAVIWILGTLFYMRDHWKELSLGDKRIYIPLLVIVCAMTISGFGAPDWKDRLIPCLMGIVLFATYVVSRRLGSGLFIPVLIGAGIVSIGVIIHSFTHPGVVSGGYVFEYNYDIVVGYVLLGAAVIVTRYQWIIASASLVIMFLTGSPEGLFAVVILGVSIIIRRDWGKKLVYAVIPLIVIAGIWFSVGWGQQLYGYAIGIVKGEILPLNVSTAFTEQNPHIETLTGIEKYGVIGFRFHVIDEALKNIKLLGEGYMVTDFQWNTVHNVPLILVQQIGYPGIVAGLAWLWVTCFSIYKSKGNYAVVLLLALSVFDHYIWTQIAPFWWVVIGSQTMKGMFFKNEIERLP